MTPNFQLPLSGSHAHAKEEYGWDTVGYLSTPSLGITTHVVQVVDVAGGPNFQLPLSGSPSPIPGFFGSPRLSAAAPLRTNDF